MDFVTGSGFDRKKPAAFCGDKKLISGRCCLVGLTIGSLSGCSSLQR